jgi:hypothetical protein
LPPGARPNRSVSVKLPLAEPLRSPSAREEATAAFEDFKATVPKVTTISQIKKWMYPTADLYGYEPLHQGLRLAGVEE